MESSTAGVMVVIFGSITWIGSWLMFNATIDRFRDRSLASGVFWTWLAVVAIATFIGAVSFWAQPS